MQLIPSLYPPSLRIQTIELTHRQFDVLAAFLELLKPQAVATLLGISNKGVEAHIYNIKQKLPLKRKDLRHFLDTCSERQTLKTHYQYLLLEHTLRGILKDLPPSTYRWSKPLDATVEIESHLKMAHLTYDKESPNVLDPSPLESLPYYEALTQILKKAFPALPLNGFLKQKTTILKKSFFLKKFPFLKGILLCVLASCLYFLWEEPQRITSELIVPIFSIKRPKMIEKLDHHLKSNLVILVGIEGSGKTTLTHIYANQHKEFSLAFELNSESRETLIQSLFDLAHALSPTKELSSIQPHQEKALKRFIKKRLKARPSWLLIFDNLNDPRLLKDFVYTLPQEGEAQKIIVTSRNMNLKYHSKNVLPIDALDPFEIMNLSKKHLGEDFAFTGNIGEYLDPHGVPPFPLDVIMAINRMRSSNMSFKDYVKLPSPRVPSLIRLLKKIDDPSLLLLCLLDERPIPKDLPFALTSTLIHDLKEHSLIHAHSKTFSFPRKIQKAMLDALIKDKGLLKIKEEIPPLIQKLIDYVDQEDVLSLQRMIPHLEKVLTSPLLEEPQREAVKRTLLRLYYYAPTNKIPSLSNPTLMDHLHTGRIYAQLNQREPLAKLLRPIEKTDNPLALSFMGDMYNALGAFKKAKEVLTASCNLYKEWGEGLAQAQGHLGDTYINLGEYRKAKRIIYKSYGYYRTFYPKNHYRIGWALQKLGLANLRSHDYSLAIGHMRKGLAVYKEYFEETHIFMVWANMYLGEAYIGSGLYKKALKILERIRSILNHHYLENDLLQGLSAYHLGRVFLKTGHLEQAEDFIKESLKYLKDSPFNYHMATTSLGELFALKKDYQKAEALFKEALEVLRNTPERYRPLAGLYRLYWDQYLNAKQEKQDKLARVLQDKSLSILAQISHQFKEDFPWDKDYINQLIAYQTPTPEAPNGGRVFFDRSGIFTTP